MNFLILELKTHYFLLVVTFWEAIFRVICGLKNQKFTTQTQNLLTGPVFSERTGLNYPTYDFLGVLSHEVTKKLFFEENVSLSQP